MKDERNQFFNYISTSYSSQIFKESRKGEGEISNNEWVYKLFHCQENKNMVPATHHDKSAQQKVENLIHYQRGNAAKTHSVPDRRDNSPIQEIKELAHDKQLSADNIKKAQLNSPIKVNAA